MAAAAAKLLQLCPTLHDPIDCSLPGSAVHGIFQARVLEWGAIAFSARHQQISVNSRVQSEDLRVHQLEVGFLVPPLLGSVT